MQISLSTTVAAILCALTVTAAPAPTKRQEIIGEYTTYSDTHCKTVIAHDIITPASCQGLPEANSVNATFSDAQGYEFRLYYDSECNDFARVLPLDTCVNTEDYFSTSLFCTGGILCPIY